MSRSAKTSLADWQLGLIKMHRNERVWTVVWPISPGSRIGQGPSGTSEALTYDVAVQRAIETQQRTPWMRSQNRIVEIHCNGQFAQFGA